MERSDSEEGSSTLQTFLEAPTDDLGSWAELWEADRVFPVRTHRPGLVGRVIVALKRLVRSLGPLVTAPQADLWERQRSFNAVVIRNLEERHREISSLARDAATIGKDLQHVQKEILEDIRLIQRDVNADVRGLSDDLDDFRRKGMIDLMRHTDALFSRLDQKLDRLSRVAGEPGVRRDLGD